MTRVQDPSGLDRETLESVVREIQELLYQELDGNDEPVWNPEKEWSGDHLEQIADILRQYDLTPSNDEDPPCPT